MSEHESTNWKDYRPGHREMYRVYKWAWDVLLGPSGRRYVKRMTAFMVIGTLVGFAIPWIFGLMINRLMSHNAAALIMCFVAYCVVRLLRNVLRHMEARTKEIAVGECAKEIDETSNRLFMEKSLGQHLREQHKLSAANVEKGRANIWALLTQSVNAGLDTVLSLAAAFIFLWCMSPFIGLMITIMFVFYYWRSLQLNKRVAQVCMPIEAGFRAHNRSRIERWDRVERVKTFGKEKEEVGRLARMLTHLIDDQDRPFWLWFTRQADIRNLFAELIFMGAIMVNILWRAWNNPSDVGMVWPLTSWTLLVVENIWRLGGIEHQFSWALPSVRAMKEALTIEPDIVDKPDAIVLSADNGIRVRFDNVSHTYQPDSEAAEKGKKSRAVLQNVSFEIQPGKAVALLGRSGAGKSTLMRLLQRGMDPDAGRILINGHDLRDVRLSSWLKLVGYIPQQPAVLDGTIRYNLTYGLTEAEAAKVTDEEVWQLMRDLQIDFGDRLTHGIETRVGRNGIRLSGGEAQRLMIGAAVMKRPHFMLIDEATSSLDSTTERGVQAGLAKTLSSNIGALIITHHLSTVRDICDQFVMLRHSDDTPDAEPQIEAVADSFEELARISPTFRQLAHDQHVTIHAPSSASSPAQFMTV